MLRAGLANAAWISVDETGAVIRAGTHRKLLARLDNAFVSDAWYAGALRENDLTASASRLKSQSNPAPD